MIRIAITTFIILASISPASRPAQSNDHADQGSHARASRRCRCRALTRGRACGGSGIFMFRYLDKRGGYG